MLINDMLAIIHSSTHTIGCVDVHAPKSISKLVRLSEKSGSVADEIVYCTALVWTIESVLHCARRKLLHALPCGRAQQATDTTADHQSTISHRATVKGSCDCDRGGALMTRIANSELPWAV